MHRLIHDHLEEVLAKTTLPASHPASSHLRDCTECREVVGAMRSQNELLHALSLSFESASEMEPRPGFYARVLEQIAVQGPVSNWALFTDLVMGKRLVTASLAAALAMGLFVVTSERNFAEEARATEQLDPLYPAAGFPTDLMAANSSSSAVFVNLVSYQGR